MKCRLKKCVGDKFAIVIKNEKEEREGVAKIIGVEWGWWVIPNPDWIYIVLVKGYELSLKIEQQKILNGKCIIWLNGITARVITSEQTKIK